jgi:kynurenine formamidase
MFVIDPERFRIVDLSYEVVPGANPDRPFEMSRGTLADQTYRFDITRTHSHVGTHV